MDASRARYGVVIRGRSRDEVCCVLVAPVPDIDAIYFGAEAWTVIAFTGDGRFYREVATFGPDNKWEEQHGGE